MGNHSLSRALTLPAVCLAITIISAPSAHSADKAINLDGTTGNESTVSTSVVTTSPVKIRNKVTNRAVGQAFRFSWPSAGPGGFFSEAGTATHPGTTTGVGAIWTWETTQQVFSFTGNQCSNDICFTRTFPSAAPTLGAFGVPGRTLTANRVTLTNASLTASLLTFFSPEVELLNVTSSVELLGSGLFKYKTTFTNNTPDPIVVDEEPAPLGCDSFCGNSTIEGQESCDGTNLGGRTCEDFGMTGPGLACDATCQYDTSGCQSPVCGNGMREGFESCDGSDLGFYSCEYFGGSGSLGCDSSCNLDFSGCSDICGNGVREEGEDCDGSAGKDSCDSIDPGATGTLACSSCQFDLSGCVNACGNGIQESGNGEDCDQYDLGGQSCESATDRSGYLYCNSNCSFNTTFCTCGDGVRNGLDSCDGEDVGDSSCEDYGGTGGTLSCTSECSIDISQCTGLCGNGVREGDEQCDGTSLGDATCESFGASGGTLSCAYSCHYDLTGCTGICGNGTREGAEDCDGDDLNGEYCPSVDEKSKRAFGATGVLPTGASQTAGMSPDGRNAHDPSAHMKLPAPTPGLPPVAETDGRALMGAAAVHAVPGSLLRTAVPVRTEADRSASAGRGGNQELAPTNVPRIRRIGPNGKPTLVPAPDAKRGDTASGVQIAPELLGGGNGIVCDATCHFDRSNCSFPCEFPGGSHTIPGGGEDQRCEVSLHPAKEITGEVTVCGPGIPQGDPLCSGSSPATQGTANLLVPDEDVTITGPYLVTRQVQVLDPDADGLAEPGETFSLLIYLTNVGPSPIAHVHATLSVLPVDTDRDGMFDPVTIVQGESNYPDAPCMAGLPAGSGDCDSPASLPPSCANLTPFIVTLAARHPSDVSRTFTLSITGDRPGAAAPNGRHGAGTVVAGFGTPGSVFPLVIGTLGVGGPVCGDGILQPGEQCDDHNTIPGDCCSPNCLFETGPCSDGNVCTVNDTCASGTCVPGSANSCNDGNPCTNDACSSTAGGDGCTHVNNTNPCTPPGGGSGVCSAGACVPGALQCPIAIVEADTTVKIASPTSNYGKKVEIEADRPPGENRALLRIRIAGTAGQTIQHARLRLFPRNSVSSGGRIHKAACNWTETGVTWNTQPSFTSTPLDTEGAIVKNRRVEFDLTGALQGEGDGTYCFLIDNILAAADYNSRDSNIGRPDVVLETAASCTPLSTSIQADATVVSNTPSANFGAAAALGVDGSPIKQTFFRVVVNGVGSRTVTSARLRLMVANISGSNSDHGGSIKLVPSPQCGTWTESGITYNNRPSTSGSTLSSFGSVKANDLAEFDLKTTITGDGTYCYRLESSDGDGADYNSKEGPVLRPELVLTVAP